MKSAAVTEHWPDSVTVKVTERSALAAVESGSLGQAAWALVDGTGRVLADQARRPAGLLALSVPVEPGPPGSVCRARRPAGGRDRVVHALGLSRAGQVG